MTTQSAPSMFRSSMVVKRDQEGRNIGVEGFDLKKACLFKEEVPSPPIEVLVGKKQEQ